MLLGGRTRADLVLENLTLRQQLAALMLTFTFEASAYPLQSPDPHDGVLSGLFQEAAASQPCPATTRPDPLGRAEPTEADTCILHCGLHPGRRCDVALPLLDTLLELIIAT